MDPPPPPPEQNFGCLMKPNVANEYRGGREPPFAGTSQHTC
jgi:hypothetical protein